jgi:hypothetical protein
MRRQPRGTFEHHLLKVRMHIICKVRVIQKLTKIFSLIFLHGLIELVEFYKTVYIKTIWDPVLVIKIWKNVFFIYRRKTVNFSTNSIFLVIFHYQDSLRICSMDSAWKIASNDIGFVMLTCEMVRQLLSIRKHPYSYPSIMPKKLQPSLDSCFIL